MKLTSLLLLSNGPEPSTVMGNSSEAAFPNTTFPCLLIILGAWVAAVKLTSLPLPNNEPAPLMV